MPSLLGLITRLRQLGTPRQPRRTASAAACAARRDSSGSSPPSPTLMSTRLAALRAEAAASTAPVTASPRRFGLPASASRAASQSHPRADPGDLQRHEGRAQQCLLPLDAPAGSRPGKAERLEHGRVGPGVLSAS